MKPRNEFLIGLGWTLFLIGSLLGILYFAGLVWPSLEAHFYFGYTGGAETTLKLSCPRLITPQDQAVVTASIPNKTDKAIAPDLETQISGPIPQDLHGQATIESGQTARITWAVNADDLAFGHLILAQVYQFATYKTPSAMANCGSLFLSVPGLTGLQVYILAFVVSMGLLIAGLVLWRVGSGELTGLGQERFSGMLVLGGIILVGIFLGTIAQWILGTFALVLATLLWFIQIGRRLSPS